MKDIYNLKRFINAQETTYYTALKEIKNGKKKGHWMWFVFPQIDGLGLSATSKKYSIKNRKEANHYLNHEILGKRLIEITSILINLEDTSVKYIFGYPDYLKLKSSMTLFKIISTNNNIFSDTLNKYFNGEVCEYTKNKLS